MCRPFMAELKTNPDLPGVQKVLLPFAITASGQLVSPTVAASRIAGILSNTRTASGAGNNQGGQGNLREPLGELVSVNMELEGLKGQPVFLSWEIFQTGSHTNLYGKWLSDFAAYRLQATTEDDTGSLDVWIPLPVAPGPYFIRLSLASDGARLASMDSSPFG